MTRGRDLYSSLQRPRPPWKFLQRPHPQTDMIDAQAPCGTAYNTHGQRYDLIYAPAPRTDLKDALAPCGTTQKRPRPPERPIRTYCLVVEENTTGPGLQRPLGCHPA